MLVSTHIRRFARVSGIVVGCAIASGAARAEPPPEKIERTLYFPDAMLKRLNVVARKIDSSYSWLLQRAWHLKHDTIAAFPAAARGAKMGPSSPTLDAATAQWRARYGRRKPIRAQFVVFPQPMFEQIEREAKRQDRSLSWLVQIAWALAEDEIEKLPPRTPPESVLP